MSVRPIPDPLQGERVLQTHPAIAPLVDAGWRRRLNLFPGRALSDTALSGEQRNRAGRLAAAGQSVTHGVVRGLEVGIGEVAEPVRVARERPQPNVWPYWDTATFPDPAPQTLPRAYVHLSPGYGVAASGEDVYVAEALRIPLDELWVYAPGGAAPPPPTGEGPVGPPELPPTRTDPPQRPPPVSPLEFRGPLGRLRRLGTPDLPRVMVLVLQPVTAETVGDGTEVADPCEVDVEAEAYANWQIADGARLVLYAWPWPELLPPAAAPTGRNDIADRVFRWEAAAAPGEVHPWERVGVPLALLAFPPGFDRRAPRYAPAWVDSHTVVRAGGKPRHRTALAAGVGNPVLWQARLQQFAEEAAEVPWSPATAAGVMKRFRRIPPAGVLPRAAAGPSALPAGLFPPGFMVDAAPVPLEQLDAVFEASASLDPLDLGAGTPDRVRVLVPVPEAWYDPRLLRTESVSPEFQRAVDAFIVRRTELIQRREDLRRKASGLVAAVTGTRPQYPRPDRDPDRLENDDVTTPVPLYGPRAHDAVAATGWHGHFFVAPAPFAVELGDALFAYVYVDPVNLPRGVALRWRPWESQTWLTAFWGAADEVPPGVVHAGPLPPAGEWVRLELPAYRLGLERARVAGTSFELLDGHAVFDRAGRLLSTDRIWFDDALPVGVSTAGSAAWEWITANPAPLSGGRAFRVPAGSGETGERFFTDPADPEAPLRVGYGDRLFAYVYLQPGSLPQEIMLEWHVGADREHRAYWGSDLIARGGSDSPARWRMGDLPSAGGWVRLEVPAERVGLEGRTVSGMSFLVRGGPAVFDRVGTAAPRTRPPGTGLQAEYFQGTELKEFRVRRVDPRVDFNWQYGTPDPAITGDTFSARWMGQVLAPLTDDFVFSVLADDGVRLWIDGQLVIDSWRLSPGEVRSSAPIRMLEGTRHDIRMEYFEGLAYARVQLFWESPNLPREVIPTRFLYPTATAGLEVLPRPEEPWVDDDVPAGSYARTVHTDAAWTWIRGLDPAEEEYGTELQGTTRVSVAVRELRGALQNGSPLRPADLVQFDQLGLEGFVQSLEARVRRADDYVDFGFLRVQSDMYRVRKLMLGATQATRLATSPALAAITERASAAEVNTELKDYLRTVRLYKAPPVLSFLVDEVGPRALSSEMRRAAELAEGVGSVFPKQLLSSPLSLMRTAGQPVVAASAGLDDLDAGAPAAAAAAPPPLEGDAPVSALRMREDAEGGMGVALRRRELDDLIPEIVAPITRRRPATPPPPVVTVVRPPPPPGVPTDAVLRKEPIVGETRDFRTVTVGERMVTPAAAEAKSFALLSRYQVLDGLRGVDLHLDDLVLPGFARRNAQGGLEVRVVYDKDGRQLSVPVREARSFASVKGSLENLVLKEGDPADADEPTYFNVAVEVLDATIAGLRVVEGRVQQYREALNLCIDVLNRMRVDVGRVDARLKVVGDDLAEARHDVAVARALLAEETARITGINDRRAAILREHVPFLVYHRPRLVHGDAELPVRPLEPAYMLSPVPAALADTEAAPPELRAIVEMLREAPVRWFPGVLPLVDRLDRPDVLYGTMAYARQRAVLRPAPESLERWDGRTAGRLGEAIQKRLAVQREVVAQSRRVAADVDLAAFQGQSWAWMRDRAAVLLSMGDLIDASHGRTKVDRAAARELDDVLRIATALHERFGDVLPVIRLDWAERYSQYDDAVDLRNLYSLPRWGEIEYLARREMQALVDWLYSRVDPAQPEAMALMGDVVRICLLLASHAPVSQLVAGAVARETRVRQGATVPLRTDLSRIRIGMPVLMYDRLKRPVHGVVEDLDGDFAVTRVLKTADTTPVTLDEGARVQFGEAVTVAAADAVERTPERAQGHKRLLGTLAGRREAVEKGTWRDGWKLPHRHLE